MHPTRFGIRNGNHDTEVSANRLRITQSAIQRVMLGIPLRNQTPNEDIRR